MHHVSKTVSEDITIRGTSYSNLQKVSEIYLSPAPAGSGYKFHVANKQIQYDLLHLWGVQKLGARFNILSDKEDTALENKNVPKGLQIKVVEHLASALSSVGITDVHINFDAGKKQIFFVPIVGAGIKKIVDAVRHKTVDIVEYGQNSQWATLDPTIFSGEDNLYLSSGSFNITINPREKTIRYWYLDKGVERAIELMPAPTCSIVVQSAHQHDVVSLGEQPFEIDNLHEVDEQDLQARPLARVANLKSKVTLSLLTALGICNGITKENYFFANPGDSASKIIGKMLPKYRSGHNEHLAHSAISDFQGEKQALCNSLQVKELQLKVTLHNTNHLFRVSALKQIFKDGILVK